MNLYRIFLLTVIVCMLDTSLCYGQDSGFQVHLRSSLGYQIEDAQVSLILSDSPNYQGTRRTHEKINLINIGNGRFRLNEPAIFDHSVQLELSVHAQNHESYRGKLNRVTSNHIIELYHNNYYQKCNELENRNNTFLSWTGDTWVNCDVNEHDLIEVFGIESKNILNSAQRRDHIYNVNLYKYAPSISNDYSNYAPRYRAYRTIISQLLYGISINQAIIHQQELLDWVNLELDSDKSVSKTDLILTGAQLITGFSEMFNDINSGLQTAGYILDIYSAKQKGYLDGVIMFISYKGAVEDLLNRLDELILTSWLSQDLALRNAIQDVRRDYLRNKGSDLNTMISAVVQDRVAQELEDIMFRLAIKGSLRVKSQILCKNKIG